LGKGHRLTLISDKPTKPRRTYAGEPLECKVCNNRSLIELRQPTYRDGKVRRGTHSSWLCPYCQRIVWP
jgi:uncharacterized protein with PIN domain